MKVNAGQLGAAIDRANPDIRLYLLHGPDEAGAMDYAQRLARAMGKDAERIDLDGATLKAHPGRLADEAAALSLFGGKRFIRVTGMGEESAEAISLLLDAPAAGSPVVAIAPNVKGTGKLLKTATPAKTAMVLACYQPEGPNAQRLAAQIARDHGVRLTGDTPAELWEASGGDRAVLTREIEKLALFLDAAPDRPREADSAVLALIGANIADSAMATAIEMVITGRPIELGAELAGLENAGMAVPTLRSLGRRLIALAEMRADVDAGSSADSVVEKYRVFWKEKASTIKALQRWDSTQIARGVDRVRQAERALLYGGAGGATVSNHELVAIARAVARR